MITRVIVISNFQLVGHWWQHVEQTVQDGLQNEFICMDAIDRDGMGPYFVKYNSKPHNVLSHKIITCKTLNINVHA